jgi:hypothetical protein
VFNPRNCQPQSLPLATAVNDCTKDGGLSAE